MHKTVNPKVTKTETVVVTPETVTLTMSKEEYNLLVDISGWNTTIAGVVSEKQYSMDRAKVAKLLENIYLTNY